MTCDPDKHHRRSIRLRGYDYALAGAYFVSIVTQDRVCLLGEVVEGAMRLNDAGQMVRAVWDELPVFYPGVDIDGIVVMPNHIHGIIILVGAAPGGRPDIGSDGVPDSGQARPNSGQARGPAPTAISLGDTEISLGDTAMSLGHTPMSLGHTPMSLGDVVHRFKTMTTKRYADGVKQAGWATFQGRLWQRNYYEHIIRDEPALDRIRRYIDENPLRWAFDAENQQRATS
jgi:REP element-mobilizing transposase RayT